MGLETTMTRERILFVTGRLAETPLRSVLARIAARAKFDYDVAVLGISVAALMHVDWLLRKLDFSERYDRVVLPGWCQGEIERLAERFTVPFERGPKDLHDLPEHLANGAKRIVSLDAYNIEIIAEINHVPEMSAVEVLAAAESLRADGADVIDLGCIPGRSCAHIGTLTRKLRRAGFRVSIDSFDRAEVEAAVAAGAELVLSVNGSNVEWGARLEAEVVAIPDADGDLDSLAGTIDALDARGARFRIDPVLNPIGFGFAASLARYFEVRRRWPKADMLLGVGNVTELTEVDSAGVNLLLAAVCQEWDIKSVLTTQVINWARSSVRELDLARRLVHYSVRERALPKHIDSQLLTLRDPKLVGRERDELKRLAEEITDPNFRIFAEQGEIHVMNRDGYFHGTDPFILFEQALAATPKVSAVHAFYLGYEMAKAASALALGKQYTQDEALRWGFLSVPETKRHERAEAIRTRDRSGVRGSKNSRSKSKRTVQTRRRAAAGKSRQSPRPKRRRT